MDRSVTVDTDRAYDALMLALQNAKVGADKRLAYVIDTTTTNLQGAYHFFITMR